MTVAALNRPSPRRMEKPASRRLLVTAASVALHAAILAPMALLAVGREHALPAPPPPLIYLEIEPRPLLPDERPRPRPVPPLPLPRPEREMEPEPRPEPELTPETPRVAPVAPQVPQIPQPAQAPQAAPTVAPRAAPQTITPPRPTATPAPLAPIAPITPVAPPAPAAAPRATPSPVAPIRPREKDDDENEVRSGLPSAPAPRVAQPAPGAPSPPASGVGEAWRFTPESQDSRNARALRVSPAGCRSPELLTPGERAVCDDRFNARAAEGAERGRITGSGNAQRDARFAREGAREMQRYEQQRRPLSGGVGVVGPGDCPGSNFGTGCAGAHLRDVPGVDMRQGARSTVNEGERRNSGFSASVGGLRVGGDDDD